MTARLQRDWFPSDWKITDVAIFKKGAKDDLANYRPVSLTSVPCKIMESLIKDNLKVFLEKKEAISSYGFMEGRSCLTNLLESVESWTQALDEGFGIDVLYLDYRKAFDSVPHKRLVGKLTGYEINGKLLRWIHSFWATVCKTLRPMLSDRCLSVYCLSCPVLSCL